MPEKLREEQIQLITWSIVAIAGFTIACSLYFTRGVIVPFVLAAFIASMVAPLVDYQVLKLRFPRPLAVTCSMLVVIAVVAVFSVTFLVALQTLADNVKEYSENFSSMSKLLLGRLEQWGAEVDLQELGDQLKAQIPTMATRTIGTITHLIGTGTLVLVFSAFLLSGRTVHVPMGGGIYGEVDSKIRSYLVIKVLVSAGTGLAVWVILTVFGLRMALVFGFMTFLLNFIPSVGSIIATLLPIPVALSQFESLGTILMVIGFPGAVQLTVGNVIEPKLQGSGMNLHPVVILLSLALWGMLWGITGMVLAVPMTAILRIVLMRFHTTMPIAQLLAGELPRMAPASGGV